MKLSWSAFPLGAVGSSSHQLNWLWQGLGNTCSPCKWTAQNVSVVMHHVIADVMHCLDLGYTGS